MKNLNLLFAGIFLSSLLQAQTTIFISPTGKDGNTGTKEKPFATLVKARDAIRKLGEAKSGSTVIIKGGTYNITEPFELTNVDGGTKDKPVTYIAAKDEKVVFNGGIVIPSSKFRPIKDENTLNRVSPELQGKIVELDLSDYELNHFKQYPDIFNDDGGIMGLFVNGERMPLSRYPNKGDMAMK